MAGFQGKARTMLGVRVDREVVPRMDAYAAWLAAQTPGVGVSRADAARAVLLKGLALVEDEMRHGQASPPTRRGKRA